MKLRRRIIGLFVDDKGGGKTRSYYRRNKYDTRRCKVGVGIVAALLLISALLFSSCGFPGVVSTPAQLPTVKVEPTATSLPPIRFPQDEAPHPDLTEWW